MGMFVSTNNEQSCLKRSLIPINHTGTFTSGSLLHTAHLHTCKRSLKPECQISALI